MRHWNDWWGLRHRWKLRSHLGDGWRVTLATRICLVAITTASQTTSARPSWCMMVFADWAFRVSSNVLFLGWWSNSGDWSSWDRITIVLCDRWWCRCCWSVNNSVVLPVGTLPLLVLLKLGRSGVRGCRWRSRSSLLSGGFRTDFRENSIANRIFR